MNRLLLSLILCISSSLPVQAMDWDWSGYKAAAVSGFTDYVAPASIDVGTYILEKTNPLAALAWRHKGKIALCAGGTACVIYGALLAKGYFDKHLTEIDKKLARVQSEQMLQSNQLVDIQENQARLELQNQALGDGLNIVHAEQRSADIKLTSIQKQQRKHSTLLSAVQAGYESINLRTAAIHGTQHIHGEQLDRIESAVNKGFQGVTDQIDELRMNRLAPQIARGTWKAHAYNELSGAPGSSSLDLDRASFNACEAIDE